MNPDLAKERAHCPFSKEEMTHLMDGGQDKTAERRTVQKLYFEHPEVSLPTSRPWMLIAFYHYASVDPLNKISLVHLRYACLEH